MDNKISPIDYIKLWNLLAAGREEWASLLVPEWRSEDRKTALKLGLITADKEKPKEDDLLRLRKKSKAKQVKETTRVNPQIKLKLTDEGLAYLGDHLDAPLPKTSKAFLPVLEFILGRLAAKGPGREVLASLLGRVPRQRPEPRPKPILKPTSPVEPLTPEIVLARIRALPRASFMSAGGLRLCELRKALPNYPRNELDKTLLAMQSDGKIVIYRFDSPAMIRKEDEEAAMYIAGLVRHYIYVTC
ncbi:MAG: hypothetical protein LBE31_04935 [Deltaproteobacteria bacterium]|jgi:hypothetical protein|nr:hypothetical protein [Deltaproteobacteria bacterium]